MTTLPLAWIIVFLVITWLCWFFDVGATGIRNQLGAIVFLAITGAMPATALLWALKAIFMP